MPNWGGGASGALSGAGTGASIGSIVPGIGTAVGAGIGAVAGGIKGLFSKKKKKPGDKADAGDPNSPENLLKTGAQDKNAQGASMIGQGAEAINPAMSYYKSLIGEDPAALMDATRGDRGRVIDQYDAARQATAQFGPRGGGVNSALAASRTAQAGQLGDIMASGKQEAAGKLGELGTTLTGLGLTSEQLASSDLNSLLSAVLTREGFDIEKRGQNASIATGIGSAAGSLLGAYLTRSKAA